LAYQGYGRRLNMKAVKSLNAIASEGLRPHVTILLDVPVKRGLKLAKKKKNRHDRLERAGFAFHERVRAGFLQLAKKEPRRFRVIMQQKTIQETQSLIRKAVALRLTLRFARPSPRGRGRRRDG
jgi:dTMP kinase